MEKRLFIVSFLVLMLTLPFLNKAFHFDDVFFIYVARQMVKDPLHPYSFDMEFAFNTAPATRMTDPPLMSGYIGAIILLFGEAEWILHLSYVIFPLIAGISMYYIAKKFTDNPLLPTMFLVTSVAFVANAHNLMVDIPFLAFFLLSIALFIYGVDSNRNYLIALGVIFSGMTYLIKYSALIIFPVLVIYALSKKKFKPLLYLTIPIFIMIIWNLYTYKIYGVPHNIEALNWLFRAQKISSSSSIIIKSITNLTYIGGATLFPLMLLYPFIIHNNNKLAYIVIAVIASILSVILYFISINFVFQYTVPQLALFAFFLSMGLFLLFVIMRYYWSFFLKFSKSKNMLNNSQCTDNIFLFSWFLIGFLFNSAVAGGAVRYVTILIPPMMIMYFNIIDYYKLLSPKHLKNFVLLGLVLTSLLIISVAYADYRLADTYRDFTKEFQSKALDKKVFYTGNNNFQYYMGKIL